ncbi:hypothetical protein AK812_SmicGene28936 [Symbiodinium microadriaticum]|uniref:Uncharacterized protein n=1 Tax=Symbiodinium microadriaticum TaxID=2951 RepID=A0A1Q9D347_SYMMI|nr:hypothetical protein AK812_SmicGene28936 [Symbiodinium microadriaticum]
MSAGGGLGLAFAAMWCQGLYGACLLPSHPRAAGACDIFVAQNLAEEVRRVLRQIPRSLGLIPRSSRSIAFTDSDGEVVLVSRSFLNIPAVTLLNPSSVSQSTTEARTRQGYHGRKPSESFMIVHASRRLPAEQTKHIRSFLPSCSTDVLPASLDIADCDNTEPSLGFVGPSERDVARK